MPSGTAPVVLVNCAIVDALRDEPRPEASVLIADGRIAAIGPRPSDTRGVRVVDLEGATVMPGLWDVHCHLSLLIPDPTNHSRFDTESEASIRAGHHAMSALRAGFTGLRVTGEVNGIDFAWRAAFRNGMFPGPRMYCAGHLLGTTGGHLRQSRFEPLHLRQLTVSFDGPAEAMRAAREQIHRGADLVKIAITGGMGLHEAMDEAQMTGPEVDAVVAVAKAKGRRIAAHASGGEITKVAIRRGITSVEHGYVLDEECIELMAAAGTTFVPTIGVTHDPDFAERHLWSEPIVAKAARSAPAHRAAFDMARARGLRICAGGDKYPITDSGLREIEIFGELGMTNQEVIRACTLSSAELCGVDADLGTIEVGKVADLLVLRGNPLADLSAIRAVAAVLKSGRFLVDHLTPDRLVEEPVNEGVSVLGVPLPPLESEPVVRHCC